VQGLVARVGQCLVDGRERVVAPPLDGGHGLAHGLLPRPFLERSALHARPQVTDDALDVLLACRALDPGAVAGQPFAQARHQGIERGRVLAHRFGDHALDLLEADLAIARGAEAKAQTGKRAAGATARLGRELRLPHVEQGLKAPGGHARIVHGLAVLAVAHAPGGLAQRVDLFLEEMLGVEGAGFARRGLRRRRNDGQLALERRSHGGDPC